MSGHIEPVISHQENAMSTFGDIERTFAGLYEYRSAIGAGVLVILTAFTAFGY